MQAISAVNYIRWSLKESKQSTLYTLRRESLVISLNSSRTEGGGGWLLKIDEKLPDESCFHCCMLRFEKNKKNKREIKWGRVAARCWWTRLWVRCVLPLLFILLSYLFIHFNDLCILFIIIYTIYWAKYSKRLQLWINWCH